MMYTKTIFAATFILSVFSSAQLAAQSQQGAFDPGATSNTACSFAYSSSLNLAPAGNVTASDNVYATANHCACCDANTSCLQVNDFGFSIPSSATITGIMVEIEKHASNNSIIQDNGLRLLKNGAEIGTSGAQIGVNWPYADTYITYGGSTNLWGATWTPADINANNFGLVFASIDYSCSGITTSYIDHIRVTVFFDACSTSVSAAYSSSSTNYDAAFTDLSSNATSWFWDFGDGTTSTLQNPLHAYPYAGTFNVCLIASDSCGSDTVCNSVVICDSLVTDFFVQQFGLDIACGNQSMNETSWIWDFGDGTTSGSHDPLHSYLAPGIYTICLTNANACISDTMCVQIEICDYPVADFNALANGPVVDFTNGSQNSDYWEWDFGDGNTSTLQSPTHTYAGPGVYLVCLKTGNNCYADSVCRSVIILETTGLEGSVLSAINVYPNPAKDILYITFPDAFPVTQMELALYDRLGKIVVVKNSIWNNTTASLDLSGLAAGAYCVRISGEGVSLTHTMLIEK